jgi:site-specific DNA recombinase
MKTCFGYIRVSTQKQGEGVSLEAQKDAIAAFASRNNITISEWFEEKETAAKSGRPIFSRMLKLLERGKADGLVIHKIDRSARNLKDWAVIGDLSDRGIDVYFATESLDFRSRGGRLTADIQAVIAADYIRNLRDETLKGMRGRLKQGLYPWGAPLGYLNNGGGKPKTICPIRGPLVRKAFQLYASGEYSIRSLVVKLAKIGLRSKSGKPLSKQSVEALLRNPFYCGLIALQTTGETFPGQHDALIDVRTFRRVQDVKAGRGKKASKRHDHLYRGLFRCGLCAAALSPELQKGRVYYRCQSKGCPTTTIREDQIEAEVGALLTAFQPMEAKAAELHTAFTNWLNGNEQSEAFDALELRIAQAEARLERLTDLLIDGSLGPDDFNRRKHSLQLEIAELHQSRSDIEQNRLPPEEVAKFLELMKNLAELHRSAKPHEKRQMLEVCFSNRVLIGKNLAVEPANWLTALISGHDGQSGALDRTTSRALFTNPMVREGVQALIRIFDREITPQHGQIGKPHTW